MPKLLLLFAGLLSLSAQAALKCEVDLNYGLLVNEQHIRVMDEDRTVYQINGTDQLIVQGTWLQLAPEQQQQLQQFAEGIHYSMPKMILLATEGVDVAISTVEHVYLGLVGEENASYERVQGALKRVKERVYKKFHRAGEHYYIGPQSLENVDEFVDRQLEDELENVISTSVGGILSAIGGLSANSGDANIEQRVQDLSMRLENMGQEIERQVGPQADILRKKARWFCQKIQQLGDVEEQLRASVPELKPYDVILTGRNHFSKQK